MNNKHETKTHTKLQNKQQKITPANKNKYNKNKNEQTTNNKQKNTKNTTN